MSLYNCSQDADKACRLNFKNYFERFFKETLSGVIFRELVEMVEKHMRALLVEEGEAREEEREVEHEFAAILTKQELYGKLKELESLGRREQMLRVMKAYCLPSAEAR